MVATVKKLSLRFVRIPGDRADICRRTALELQAESILRAHNGRPYGHKAAKLANKSQMNGEFTG
jgi:hypothetical protein